MEFRKVRDALSLVVSSRGNSLCSGSPTPGPASPVSFAVRSLIAFPPLIRVQDAASPLFPFLPGVSITIRHLPRMTPTSSWMTPNRCWVGCRKWSAVLDPRPRYVEDRREEEFHREMKIIDFLPGEVTRAKFPGLLISSPSPLPPLDVEDQRAPRPTGSRESAVTRPHQVPRTPTPRTGRRRTPAGSSQDVREAASRRTGPPKQRPLLSLPGPGT